MTVHSAFKMEKTAYIQSKIACLEHGVGADFKAVAAGRQFSQLNVKYRNGTYFFGEVHPDVQPSLARRNPSDERYWTPWRKTNFKFIESVLSSIAPESEILDIGSGKLYFSKLVDRFPNVSVDIYPYKGTDVCADCTKKLPFNDNCFDVILLSNVLEHIADPDGLLLNIRRILRPEGIVIVTVPFLAAIHQAKYDFYRYTEFGLTELFKKHNFVFSRFARWGNSLTLAGDFLHCAEVDYRRHFAYGHRIFSRINHLLIRAVKTYIRCLEKYLSYSAKSVDSGCNFSKTTPFGYMFVAKKAGEENQ